MLFIYFITPHPPSAPSPTGGEGGAGMDLFNTISGIH